MEKSAKNILNKTALLVLFCALFLTDSFAQSKSGNGCENTDYDCLNIKYFKAINNDCAGKEKECYVAEFTKMIEANPADGAAFLGRGRILFAADRQQAIKDFDEAIRLNPTYFQTYISLGLLYFTSNGDHEKAIQAFSKAVEVANLETRDAGMRRKAYLKNAYYNRSMVYFIKRDYAGALADLNSVIELNSGDEHVYLQRGEVYSALKNFESALADYNKAVEINPKNQTSYRHRGNFYRKINDNEKAEADFKKAEELKKLADK